MKFILQILCFGLFLIFTGCVTLYKPNAIHSPLLKEKGELNTTASLGLSGNGLFNLQAAYALSNHIGIMADGMYHNRQIKSADSSIDKLNMFFGEAGAGYFKLFGDKKNTLVQCYGGAGYGVSIDKIDHSLQPGPEVSSKYFNMFIQPGAAFIDKNFELAFDMRINYVKLFKIHAYLYNSFEWWNTDFHFYTDTTVNFMIFEPAITVKGGGKNLKGFLQFGITVPVVNIDSYFLINNSSVLGIPLFKFSVGISYRFGKKE
jgi:hypothetical protein